MLARIIVGIVFLPLFTFLIFLDNSFFYNIIVAGGLLFGLLEYDSMLRKAGVKTFNYLNIIFFLAVLYGLYDMKFPELSSFTIFRALTIIIGYSAMLIIIPLFKKDIKSAVFSMVFTLFGAFYIIVLGSGLFFVRSYGAKMTFFFFLTIWVYDSFAYFIGSRFGKHKMSKVISPNKSLEGLIGGLLAVIALSVILKISTSLLSIGMLQAAFTAFVVALAAQGGDLVESLVKRYCGVKDSSNLIPGHGGFLDKADSFLLAAPVFILLMNIL